MYSNDEIEDQCEKYNSSPVYCECGSNKRICEHKLYIRKQTMSILPPGVTPHQPIDESLSESEDEK